MASSAVLVRVKSEITTSVPASRRKAPTPPSSVRPDTHSCIDVGQTLVVCLCCRVMMKRMRKRAVLVHSQHTSGTGAASTSQTLS